MIVPGAAKWSGQNGDGKSILSNVNLIASWVVRLVLLDLCDAMLAGRRINEKSRILRRLTVGQLIFHSPPSLASPATLKITIGWRFDN